MKISFQRGRYSWLHSSHSFQSGIPLSYTRGLLRLPLAHLAGGSGLIHQRCLGHCRHIKEGEVGSTKEDFVLSGPKRQPEIYGKDYFADDKLQDQIITNYLALNRRLVSEHASAVVQPGVDYVIPVIGCAVLLFVCLLFQCG